MAQGVAVGADDIALMRELYRSGVSQVEIARRVGVQPPAVSRHLRGLARPRHALTDVRPDERLATCRICGPETPIQFRPTPGRWRCYTAILTWRKPGTNGARKKLGVCPERFAEMLAAQSGVCAICGGINANGRSLSVDHDHDSGKVRGLLCGNCNTAIGLMKDDPERLLRAVDYLAA